MLTKRFLQWRILHMLFLIAAAATVFAFIQRSFIRQSNLVAAMEREGFTVLEKSVFAIDLPEWLSAWMPKEVDYIEGICDSDSDIKTINACHAVRTLIISNSTLDSPRFLELGDLPYCRYLAIDSTDISDCDLEQIVQSMPNLESLSIVKTRVTPGGLACLSAATRLSNLSLDANLLTQKGMQGLHEIDSLKTLQVFGDTVDDSTLNRILDSLSLHCFVVGNDCSLSESGIQEAVDSGLVVIVGESVHAMDVQNSSVIHGRD